MSYTIIVKKGPLDSDDNITIFEEHGESANYDTLELAAKTLARLTLDGKGLPLKSPGTRADRHYFVERITGYPISPETIAELTSDEEVFLKATLTSIAHKLQTRGAS